MTTSGIGLLVATVSSDADRDRRPSRISDRDDVDARTASMPTAARREDDGEPRSCSFLAMRVAASASTSSTREAGGGRVGQHARDERAQPPFVLAGGCACCGRGADERSDAAPRLDDAGALELGVDARDGVGVDAAARRPAGGRSAAGRRAAGGRWRSPRAARARAARRSASRRAGRWRRAPLELIILVH